LKRIQNLSGFPDQWVTDNLAFAEDFFAELREEFADDPEQAAELLFSSWQGEGLDPAM
jgi:hypothetical protein